MAGSEALYRFLTTRLRDREIPVESLPKQLGVSRSTLYRNMKGTAHMAPEVKAKLVAVLGLADEDQRELDALVGLAVFDATLVQARSILDEFVFPRRGTAVPESAPLRFALYGQDTYLRSSGELQAEIRALAGAPDASTRVHVLCCTTGAPADFLTGLVEGLFRTGADVTVEHLLALSETDFSATARTFTRLVPLLTYSRYTVRYADQAHRGTPALLRDAIMAEIRRPGAEPVLYAVSFVDGDLSTCLATAEPSVRGFLQANFEALQRAYPEALVRATDVDGFSDAMAGLEEGHDVYIIKPDFSYERVPAAVYGAMMARLGPAALGEVRSHLAGPGSDPDTIVDTVLATLERRARASRQRTHIDVVSTKGLAEFARTGRLTDHLDFLPAFSPDERTAIITHVQTRYNDPGDPYTLYLTDDPLFPDGHIAMVMDGAGVLLEYNPADYRSGVISNLYITNRTLTSAFSDFVRHHVPTAHALSPEATNAFLTGLINDLA